MIVEPSRTGDDFRSAGEHHELAALIATHVAEGLCMMDEQGRLTYMNPAAERILGWRQEEIEGQVLHDVVHYLHPDGSPFPVEQCPLRTVLLDGVTIRDRDDVWIRKGGDFIPVFCSCSPIWRDERVVGAVLSLHDITERRRAEERQRLLSEASGVLSASLDPAEALQNLVRVVTEQLADYALVYTLDEDGSIRRGPGRHARPEGAALMEALLCSEGFAADSDHVVARAVRSGEPILVDHFDEALLRASSTSDEHSRILRELRPRSMLVVPLRARGHVRGALGVATVEGGRPPLGPEDAALVLELAGRAALAADNARLYEAERDARREAEEANSAKSNFLAVMSHELRTPLTAIMAFAELLQMGIPDTVPPGALSHVGRIDHAARHLLRLIEEILTFSRIEAAREEVRRVATDLAEIAREAVEFVQPLAAKKGLAVEMSAPSELVVRTDGGKVRQVLVNLLFNAVKFTPAGSIRLEVERHDGWAMMHVHDTGIGIAEELCGKIFEPFYQAQHPTTREVGGTGLGLTISQRIARLLEGDLSVRSTVGVGTTFSLKLPLDAEG